MQLLVNLILLRRTSVTDLKQYCMFPFQGLYVVSYVSSCGTN